MAAKQTVDTIMSDLKARRFKPIYILMGEEPYYIDKISDYIENNVTSTRLSSMVWTPLLHRWWTWPGASP